MFLCEKLRISTSFIIHKTYRYLANTWLCNAQKSFLSFLVEYCITMLHRQLELFQGQKRVPRISSKKREVHRKFAIYTWCHPNHRVPYYRLLLCHLWLLWPLNHHKKKQKYFNVKIKAINIVSNWSTRQFILRVWDNRMKNLIIFGGRTINPIYNNKQSKNLNSRRIIIIILN